MNTSKAQEKSPVHPKYRADIDGLRAVAVLSVVCFHAFPKVLKGGFVGVDIFFIISGFLISSILLGGLKNGSFSFKEFYIRRVLRIFPALLAVLAFCYAAGWLVLLPEEFQQLGKHMVGGAGFVSNLFFWQEAGYFDNSAETKPLLHLWSLGVEEQFYIIWPCLLLLAWKRHVGALLTVTAFIAASFAVNVHTVHTDAVQAFYSPAARFWELLLGGLLAYIKLHNILVEQQIRHRINSLLRRFTERSLPVVNSVMLNNALSVLGALLILAAVFFVHKNKPFPGWWALWPTLGAYLLISSGPEAVINRRVLSARPMVWVGIISYPLYLWHWPLLSFATIMESATPSLGLRGAAVVLAFVLAWLTYQFIERPIRFGVRSKTKISVLALLMVLLAALGCVAYFKGNVRTATLTQDLIDKNAKLAYKLHWAKWTSCPNEGASKYCKIMDPTRPAEIALIGDSHSGHLASGLAELAVVKKKNIIARHHAGCMPVFELVQEGKAYYSCEDGVINKALADVIKSDHIQTIMLSGYAMWTIQVYNPEQALEGLTGEQAKEHAGLLQKAIDNTLARLVASGKKIIFFVDIPELDFNPKECVQIRPFYLGKHVDRTPCAVPREVFNQRNADYHRIIKEEQKKYPSVQFINTYDYLCDEKLCYALKDGELLYLNRDHLTTEGSRYLIGKLADELKF